MIKFGKDCILVGDYSKYDLCMFGQMVLVVFDVLIELVFCCFGYMLEDIEFMKYLVYEIVSLIMVMNGDLIQLFGFNLFGYNLIVYINFIVNFLWFCCVFFVLKKGNKLVKFWDIVVLMIYGDDVKVFVCKGYLWFNYVFFVEFLCQYDVVFIMFDKILIFILYMNDVDVDFFKRKNIFLKEIGYYVGVLDEELIFKLLYCNIKFLVLIFEQVVV